MALIYSFVAREDTVLVEYTAFTGNFVTLSVELLSKTSKDAKRTGLFCYACDGHTFNFEAHSGFSASPHSPAAPPQLQAHTKP
jgi:vesicle-associated membrane protein 72